MWWVSGVERKSQHGLQVCVPWWRYHGDPLLNRKRGATVMWRFQSCGGRETGRIIASPKAPLWPPTCKTSPEQACISSSRTTVRSHTIFNRDLTHFCQAAVEVLLIEHWCGSVFLQPRQKNVSLACHGSSFYKKKLQHINVKMLLLAKIFERTFKKSINLLPQHDFTIKGFTIHFRPRQKKMFCSHYGMVF